MRISDWSSDVCSSDLPFVYSFPFLFGFVNYCTGIALALWTVAAWYRWRELHWAKRSGVFLAASSLIWVVHMAAWAVLVVAIGAIELANAIRSLGWRQIGRVVVTVFLDRKSTRLNSSH